MAFRALKRVPAPRPSGMMQPRHKPFLAPIKGWVSATNLAAAPDGSAQVLENWYPTSTGIKMRKGSTKHGTAVADEPLESGMSYVGLSARKMFGAADGNIFDLTSPADPDTPPAASVTGQTSNYYSHVNFANAGGNYMACANGTDPYLVFDGTDFFPVFDTSLYALNYDAETAPFTEGETLTGGTSGHTGIIVKVIDNGTDGTLWLRATTGDFQDNETITDSATGSADADGIRSLLVTGITGVATDEIDHVNIYRSRIWLTDRTMDVYALATDAISGAVAYTIALAGVFRRGGYVMATVSWSFDAGNGPNENIAFITTEGEVAIYQGDPADTATWGLVGLYDSSPMMGKNAFLKVAGDVLMVTRIGLVPLSQLKNKDPAALAIAAVSRNIQPDWQAEALARVSLPWEIVKWTSRNIAYVSCPVTSEGVTAPICFAVNLETGAWCKVTGWNTRCLVLHDDQVYFGRNDGTLMTADAGGSDDGELIYYTYIGHMDHLGAVGAYKTVTQARAIFRTLGEFYPLLAVTTDYEITLPSYPSSSEPAATSLWDIGLWGDAKWDSGSMFYTETTKWVSIARSGFAHAPVILITSGSTVPPAAELVAFDTLYNPGGLVV